MKAGNRNTKKTKTKVHKYMRKLSSVQRHIKQVPMSSKIQMVKCSRMMAKSQKERTNVSMQCSPYQAESSKFISDESINQCETLEGT